MYPSNASHSVPSIPQHGHQAYGNEDYGNEDYGNEDYENEDDGGEQDMDVGYEED